MLIAKMEFTFYLKETRLTMKMRFDFEAEDRLTGEGDWTPSDDASKELSRVYFDDVGGWWKRSDGKDGTSGDIWMREHKPATGVSVLWTSLPGSVASMYGVPKLPFTVGNKGNGVQGAQPFNSFNWKVIGI